MRTATSSRTPSNLDSEQFWRNRSVSRNLSLPSTRCFRNWRSVAIQDSRQNRAEIPRRQGGQGCAVILCFCGPFFGRDIGLVLLFSRVPLPPFLFRWPLYGRD